MSLQTESLKISTESEIQSSVRLSNDQEEVNQTYREFLVDIEKLFNKAKDLPVDELSKVYSLIANRISSTKDVIKVQSNACSRATNPIRNTLDFYFKY